MTRLDLLLGRVKRARPHERFRRDCPFGRMDGNMRLTREAAPFNAVRSPDRSYGPERRMRH
jgi:hypothetical protein